jgi:hypothetical protein
MITVKFAYYRRGTRRVQVFTGTAEQWDQHRRRLGPVIILTTQPDYSEGDRTADFGAVQKNPYQRTDKFDRP